MRKIVWMLVVVLTLGWQGMSMATTTVDALIQKLIEKGILTDKEATQIKGEIASEEKKTQETGVKSQMPDWIRNIKLSGDARLRDQYERRKKAGGTDADHMARNRGRVRARLNLEAQVNDKAKIIFGIATDGGKAYGGSARSNNVTFGGNSTSQDGFSKPYVVINKAYLVYTPHDKWTLIGGKMDNPLWEPANLFWKQPDITPEGAAIKFEKKFNDMLTPFVTGVSFVLHDQSPSSSLRTMPYMVAPQVGLKGNLTEKAYYKTAVTWYNVQNPSHTILTNTSISGSTSDTERSSTQYDASFNPVVGSLELGLNDPFGEMLPSPLYVPQIGVFGAYGQNLYPSSNKAAWQMGAYMGNSSLNGWGTWRLSSFYRVMERDAWMDTFTDDDFYGGYTDTAGYRTQLSIGLAKNVWLDLTYYRTHIYKTFTDLTVLSQKAPESLAQVDLSFKF